MQPQEFLALVQNVDPSMKDDMEKVFTPMGTGPVAASPHFVFIVCNILRGISPREVNELVEREKKAFVSIDAIREYALINIPPKLMLPNLKHRWLQKSGQLDEIDVLENLCKVQMVRIMDRLDKPSVDAEDDESKRRDIDCLRKLAMDTLKAKVETGRYIKPAEQVNVNITAQGEVKHAHVADPMGIPDARAAAAALEALKVIGMLVNKKDDDVPPIH